MSKEKQIEEMALELCRPRNIVKMIHHRTCDNCDTSSCDIYELCVDLYNAGYRKQSEGEWVKVMNHKECSKCGYNAPYKKIKAGYHLQNLSKYCPNCGAKMKGGAE